MCNNMVAALQVSYLLCHGLHRQVIISLLMWRPRFAPVSDHLGFVTWLVALGQVSLGVLRFSAVSIIPLGHDALIYHMGHEQWRPKFRDIVSPHWLEHDMNNFAI
jgi:hypothetical protein